jgi:hypothetical protein
VCILTVSLQEWFASGMQARSAAQLCTLVIDQLWILLDFDWDSDDMY